MTHAQLPTTAARSGPSCAPHVRRFARTRWALPLASTLVLVACGKAPEPPLPPPAPAAAETPSAPAPATASAAAPQAPSAASAAATGSAPAAWLGRWVGPEGTYIDIAPGGGGYALTIANLDGPQHFRGQWQGDVMVFERDGQRETLRAGNGDDTGMKWLAGKTNSLLVKSGEGWCRD